MSHTLLPIVALLLLPVLILLGIVLLIVGLVKKKPALWGSGIAVSVLGLMALAVGAGMFVFLGIRTGQTQAPAVRARAASKTMVQGFQEATGLPLPAGVSITRRVIHSSSAGPNGSTRVIIIHMSVPEDFDGFLAANFKKAQWSDAAPIFQTARSENESCLPSDSQLKNAALYVLTYRTEPDSPEMFVTAVAHDTDTHEAWTVSLEKPATAE
jgi:hypothetical protein